jgi:hypothetical protein
LRLATNGKAAWLALLTTATETLLTAFRSKVQHEYRQGLAPSDLCYNTLLADYEMKSFSIMSPRSNTPRLDHTQVLISCMLHFLNRLLIGLFSSLVSEPFTLWHSYSYQLNGLLLALKIVKGSTPLGTGPSNGPLPQQMNFELSNWEISSLAKMDYEDVCL